MNALSNGIKITVEDTGKTYHTLDDWGLALGNNNYISDPELDTLYINVPFRDGYIDASETVSNRRTYKNRQLKFELGGLRNRLKWDAVISDLRNKINGRICHLTLDNDPFYYWRGRVQIKEFDRNRELGQFKLIVNADPYKYDVEAGEGTWLWDTFSFVDGIINDLEDLHVDGTLEVPISAGFMSVAPTFLVSNIKSKTFTVSDGKHEVELVNGSNRDPRIRVNGDTSVMLTFKGKADVEIQFRGGSL